MQPTEPDTHSVTDERETLRLLIDAVEEYAVCALDLEGRVTTWNAGAQRMYGFAADEIVGKHCSAFYSQPSHCMRDLEDAARAGKHSEEGWRSRKDGSRFWANVATTALRDSKGTLVGYAQVTRDQTERRVAEQSRLAAEDRFRRLVESVKDYAIFILDPQGRVATWNIGAQRIKGYRAEEVIGRHFSIFYPEHDVRAGKCEMELEVAAREGSFEDEDWRVRKDGSRFWANVIISAIRDDHGTLVGFSKVTRDLTDRKRSEEERAARVAAEEANRTKDEFLAMLGHELRNPLAPIVTALQLLKLRREGRTARELQIIERQVGQMSRLVDDLFDVSRIGRGKLEMRREKLDLRQVIAKAVEIASPLIEQKGHHLDVKSPGRALAVVGDPARLVQVFANLLNNAAKYTQAGGHIFVSLRRMRSETVVEVRDDGAGIHAALLPRIFDLFVQGEQTADRAEGGLGLGLTLVKRIALLHGGDVEARSTGPGLGSSFTVRLPCSDEAPATENEEIADATAWAPPAKRRILIVDDNDDARVLLAEMLVELGHDVETALNGDDALDALDAFKPDVAVLDIGLPGMDGYELASRIRDADEGCSIQLIALTGYGQPNDVDRAHRAGFDAHFVKPVDIYKLTEVLQTERSES